MGKFKNLHLIYLLFCIGIFKSTSGQYTKYRICAGSEFSRQCQVLQRGNSDVTCVNVEDSIECAQQIMNATATSAQFGVFNAESTLHLAHMGWENLVVLKELRHEERSLELFDYQAVVVVKNPIFGGGLSNLKGMGFCHPGYDHIAQHKWSERFLKTFERNVVDLKCDLKNATMAEKEVASFSNFFMASCRPGPWSNNKEEDAYLKKKYQRLCNLCDDQEKCAYDSNIQGSDHRKALECVKKHGQFTYVSLQEARRFFQDNTQTINEYKFLCPNGTIQNVSVTNPCVWQSQPWPVIISHFNQAVALKTSINQWKTGSQEWEIKLMEILMSGNKIVMDASAIQKPRDYITTGRELPFTVNDCNSKITWCTTSYEENNKCKVMSSAGITSGVLPQIECRTPSGNTVQCLQDISEGKADIMGVDSNYGYIARNNFGLTAAMYAETNDQFYSKVIILIKANSKISNFKDLKGKKACFPEFGGIASIAFIDAGRSRGIFKQNECNYGKLLSEFFGNSCAPGAKDVLHDKKFKQGSREGDSLCKLCDSQGTMNANREDYNIETLTGAKNPSVRSDLKMDVEDVNEAVESRPKRQLINSYDHCSPTPNNRYFGTRGALTCLHESGEVAVLELQKLQEIAKDLKINPEEYKIMCRDGSVVPTNDFNVEQNCPLITIVDGEILIKRRSPKAPEIVHVLHSFDRYMNLKGEPDFKLYEKFNGFENLLFEHSTVGFVSANATVKGPSVMNYIRLFENADKCAAKKNSAINVGVSGVIFVFTALITVLLY